MNTDPDDRIRRRSAGVIVSRGSGQERRFLILRAWSHWDFPKGAVEPGETELQAAIRETAEETSLNDLRFLWGELSCSTNVYSRDKVAIYFLADSPGAEPPCIVRNPVSGELEHDEWRWVTWDQLPRFLPPRLSEVMDWAASLLRLPPLTLTPRDVHDETAVAAPVRTPRLRRDQFGRPIKSARF